MEVADEEDDWKRNVLTVVRRKTTPAPIRYGRRASPHITDRHLRPQILLSRNFSTELRIPPGCGLSLNTFVAPPGFTLIRECAIHGFR